jgi:hypothetical protein
MSALKAHRYELVAARLAAELLAAQTQSCYAAPRFTVVELMSLAGSWPSRIAASIAVRANPSKGFRGLRISPTLHKRRQTNWCAMA